MDPRVFLCKGCHRERPRNPRLKPDQQSYCGSRRCQNVRKRRSDAARMRDPTYAASRREAKSDWRRRHSRDDAAYRRARRAARRSAKPNELQAGGADDGPASPVAGVPSGRYLLQPLDEPGAPALSVHLVAVDRQVHHASETDAFRDRNGAP